MKSYLFLRQHMVYYFILHNTKKWLNKLAHPHNVFFVLFSNPENKCALINQYTTLGIGFIQPLCPLRDRCPQTVVPRQQKQWLTGGESGKGVVMEESLSGLTGWQILKWASVSGRWRGGPWGSVTDFTGQPFWKISLKAFTASLIHKKRFFGGGVTCVLWETDNCKIKRH